VIASLGHSLLRRIYSQIPLLSYLAAFPRRLCCHSPVGKLKWLWK